LMPAAAVCVDLLIVPSSVYQVGTLLFSNIFLINMLLSLQCS